MKNRDNEFCAELENYIDGKTDSNDLLSKLENLKKYNNNSSNDLNDLMIVLLSLINKYLKSYFNKPFPDEEDIIKYQNIIRLFLELRDKFGLPEERGYQEHIAEIEQVKHEMHLSNIIKFYELGVKERNVIRNSYGFLKYVDQNDLKEALNSIEKRKIDLFPDLSKIISKEKTVNPVNVKRNLLYRAKPIQGIGQLLNETETLTKQKEHESQPEQRLRELRMSVRKAITDYVKKSFTEKNIKKSDGAASVTRIFDMYEMLNLIKNSEDQNQIINQVLYKIETMKRTFFGSKLKENLKQAISRFKTNENNPRKTFDSRNSGLKQFAISVANIDENLKNEHNELYEKLGQIDKIIKEKRVEVFSRKRLSMYQNLFLLNKNLHRKLSDELSIINNEKVNILSLKNSICHVQTEIKLEQGDQNPIFLKTLIIEKIETYFEKNNFTISQERANDIRKLLDIIKLENNTGDELRGKIVSFVKSLRNTFFSDLKSLINDALTTYQMRLNENELKLSESKKLNQYI